MLSEDKIRLMTGIAMFEKREGKHIFPVNRYFRSDYVSRHMFRSFFSYTVSYLLCAGVWCVYNMERILNAMDIDGFLDLGKRAGFLYVAGLAVYLLITCLIYRKRYEYARRGMNVYVAKLKRLEKRYEFQNRTRELSKEGGRRDGASRI